MLRRDDRLLLVTPLPINDRVPPPSAAVKDASIYCNGKAAYQDRRVHIKYVCMFTHNFLHTYCMDG